MLKRFKNKLKIYKLGQYIFLIAAVAFIIDYIWEMAQMPFFTGMYFSDFKVWLICARASIGDVVIILIIFILGRLIFKKWNWIDHLNLLKIVYLLIMGVSIAIVIEIISLKYDRWDYSEIMPVIPKFGVGIIPITQMIILPLLSYIVASKISKFSGIYKHDFR